MERDLLIGKGLSTARGLFARRLSVAAIALLASGLAARTAMAETRGYVVSWFYMAAETQPDDCPGGTNPLSVMNGLCFLA